jgi:NADH:ubiquinone oxidoreductase subunit 5 (subunit L)/multisubunit Na+/H+ antiporter MnhA subunit
MEAPLGASALMHSSTLVIAGIVFISKVLSILTLNIYITSLAYLIGLITASTAAFVACFQFELKVIMAYSTISNMGYLLILLVTASLNEFLYLLVIHAYIKIFLFLNLGAIILHANNCQDLR